MDQNQWNAWNPEHRMLYRFIISQLHYDGLSGIALILSQSLQQLPTVEPSNHLSQLVSMCVLWGQQAAEGFGSTKSQRSVVKPQPAFPYPNLTSPLATLASSLTSSNLTSPLTPHRSFTKETKDFHLSDLRTTVEASTRSTKTTPYTREIRKPLATIPSPSLATVPPPSLASSSLVASSLVASSLAASSLAASSLAASSLASSLDMFNKTREESVMCSVTSTAHSTPHSTTSPTTPTRDPSMEIKEERNLTPTTSNTVTTSNIVTTANSLEEDQDIANGVTYPPISEDNSWTCPKCNSHVTSMTDLAIHIRLCLDTQGENYCGECGRGYSSKASLQRHISVVHRKERNYECHICRKRFGQQIHVDVHMRLHTGEKPFVCHLCNDSFKQSAHLKRHMQCHMRSPPNFGQFQIRLKSENHYKKEEELRAELLSHHLTQDLAQDSLATERDYSLCVSEAIRNQVQNKYTLELMKLIGQTEANDTLTGASVG